MIWANWACQILDPNFLGLRNYFEKFENVVENLIFLENLTENKICDKPGPF